MESRRIVLILLCGLLQPVELSSPGESMNMEHLFCKIYLLNCKKCGWMSFFHCLTGLESSWTSMNGKYVFKNLYWWYNIYTVVSQPLLVCHEQTNTFKTIDINAENNCLDRKMSHLKLEKLLEFPKNVLKLHQKSSLINIVFVIFCCIRRWQSHEIRYDIVWTRRVSASHLGVPSLLFTAAASRP